MASSSILCRKVFDSPLARTKILGHMPPGWNPKCMHTGRKYLKKHRKGISQVEYYKGFDTDKGHNGIVGAKGHWFEDQLGFLDLKSVDEWRRTPTPRKDPRKPKIDYTKKPKKKKRIIRRQDSSL